MSLLPEDPTPTTPGRRVTGEWEPVNTKEWQVRMLQASQQQSQPQQQTLGLGAWAGIIGVGISTLALALTIGGQLYQSKADGARSETKIEATVKAQDTLSTDLKETLKVLALQIQDLSSKVDRLDRKRDK